MHYTVIPYIHYSFQVIKILQPYVTDNEHTAKYQYMATSTKQIVLTNRTLIQPAEWSQIPVEKHFITLAELQNMDIDTVNYE